MTLFLDYLGTVSELNHEYDCAEFDPGRIGSLDTYVGKVQIPLTSHTHSLLFFDPDEYDIFPFPLFVFPSGLASLPSDMSQYFCALHSTILDIMQVSETSVQSYLAIYMPDPFLPETSPGFAPETVLVRLGSRRRPTISTKVINMMAAGRSRESMASSSPSRLAAGLFGLGLSFRNSIPKG